MKTPGEQTEERGDHTHKTSDQLKLASAVFRLGQANLERYIASSPLSYDDWVLLQQFYFKVSMNGGFKVTLGEQCA